MSRLIHTFIEIKAEEKFQSCDNFRFDKDLKRYDLDYDEMVYTEKDYTLYTILLDEFENGKDIPNDIDDLIKLQYLSEQPDSHTFCFRTLKELKQLYNKFLNYSNDSIIELLKIIEILERYKKINLINSDEDIRLVFYFNN